MYMIRKVLKAADWLFWNALTFVLSFVGVTVAIWAVADLLHVA